MKFDYKQIRKFESTIDIDNISQCALEVTDDNEMCHYLVIKTIMGETVVFEQGPVLLDLKFVGNNISCTISRFEYSEMKIKKIIKTFISDKPKVKVEDVRQLTMSEALDLCVDLIECMREYK